MDLNRILITGSGAVSPAGWSSEALWHALDQHACIPTTPLTRKDWRHSFPVRRVLSTPPKEVLAHPRLRRASSIAQFAVAAGLEALGPDLGRTVDPEFRLGVILCVMSGCVNYSRRFYDEVLDHPGTASPIIFPETVFNAPASHMAALLGARGINYTLVGDPGMFLSGLAMAADWLMHGEVEGCLVIGAEELDWLTVDAFRLFERQVVLSEGAGALYLKRASEERNFGIELVSITEAHSFTRAQSRDAGAIRVREQLLPEQPGHLLCASVYGVTSETRRPSGSSATEHRGESSRGIEHGPMVKRNACPQLTRSDRAELAAWRDWSGPRLYPKQILGEALAAGSAWQCVAAVRALRQGQAEAANISVVGCNQQAIGAHFAVSAHKPSLAGN